MNLLTIIIRVLSTIVSGPLLIIGCVWVLQGVNVLPGSFMTGHIQWALYGAVMALAGGGLVFWLNRPKA